MLASKGGHLDVVRELLSAQADVNVQDEVCSLKSMCPSTNTQLYEVHKLSCF